MTGQGLREARKLKAWNQQEKRRCGSACLKPTSPSWRRENGAYRRIGGQGRSRLRIV